jgi:hypothetical protein
MRIAKPLLLVTTPLGLVEGIYECYRLAGGLVFIMLAMVGVLGIGLATIIRVVRREEAARRVIASNVQEPVCKS